MKKFNFIQFFVTVTLLLAVLTAQAQIAQRGSSVNGTSTSTTLTINKPTGVVAGDVMIVNICQRGNGTTAPSLAGWTAISSGAIDGGTTLGALLYKVAGASEPASYTFTLGTGANNNTGTIVAFSGVDVSGPTPFDVAPGSLSLSGASGKTATATGITTVSANAAVIMFAQSSDNQTMGSWNTTNPGSLTEIYEDQYNGTGSNDQTIGAAIALKPAAGATGNGTVTLGASIRWGAMLVALKPAATVTLSPSTAQTISVGGTVAFTASAQNFGGSGNYTYTWTAAGATIPGSNPNTIAGASDSKTLTFPTAGTYTVSVSIARSGATTLTTSTTTVTVNPPANSPIGCDGQFFISYGSAGTATSTTSMNKLTFSGSTITGTAFSTDPTGIGFNALGLNPIDGYMYGVRYSPMQLVRIGNGTPGNVNAVGTITNAQISSADNSYAGCFDADGTYYFWTDANEFYKISGINYPTVPLAATYIGAATPASGFFVDIAIDPSDGQMYGVSGTTGTKNLYKINKTTGALTLVGTYAGTQYIAALFFDEVGTLYGYRQDGTFQQINKSTAALTQVGTSPAYTYADGCGCSFGRVYHDLDFTANPGNQVCPTQVNPNPTFPLVVTVNNRTSTQQTGLTYTLNMSDPKKRFRFTEDAATIKANLIAAGVATLSSTVTLTAEAPATGTNYNKIVVTGFQTGAPASALSFTLQVQLYTLGVPYDAVPMQSVISGLPAIIGSTDQSNDPGTIAPDDPTIISFCGNITLPVELSSFTARRTSSSNVALAWTTSMEINNSGFHVERLIGNSGNWETVGFVSSQAPAGNSADPLNYTFADRNVTKGITQYRLRQVDLDSRSRYSEIRSVKGEGQVGQVFVYPNPTGDGRVNIVFEDGNNAHDVSLSDMSGRIIKQYRNLTTNTLVLTNLVSGMYTLRIIVPETGEQTIEKIVVTKR